MLSAVTVDENFALLLYALALLLLACGALLIWSFAIAFTLFRRRHLLLATMCLVLPFSVPLIAFEAIPYAQWSVDYARFKTKQSSYDAQIAQLPKDGKRFAEFNWSGQSFVSRGVVYDETDEVGLPYGHQSTAWRKRLYDTELICRGNEPFGRTMPLGGHYYVTGFGC
jgi:hypothetical protein